MTGTAPLLEARQVAQSVDGELLLPPTDVTVHPGDRVAIVGENGSGKTTLLRILAGMARPSEGVALIDGAPLDERAPAARSAISSLIGVPAFYPDLTVHEHLRLILATWGVAGADAEQRVDDVVEQFGLSALVNRFSHELSSGQTQLFFLASAFIRPCRVLVLDEPEQRLDAGRVNRVADAVLRAAASGTAVVFASHSPALIDRVATHRVALPDA